MERQYPRPDLDLRPLARMIARRYLLDAGLICRPKTEDKNSGMTDERKDIESTYEDLP